MTPNNTLKGLSSFDLIEENSQVEAWAETEVSKGKYFSLNSRSLQATDGM